jgi:hypothetical protein
MIILGALAMKIDPPALGCGQATVDLRRIA